jgi:cobalt-zinc-cadmium efflux system outer membrane protein
MDRCRKGSGYRARLFRAGVAGLALVWAAVRADAAEAPVELTLEQAVAEAAANSPVLAVDRREIDIAAGERRQASTFEFNPEFELESDTEGETRSVGLSQTLWLKGQRSLRMKRAEAGLLRAESSVRNAEREALADTLKAFSELLVSQHRLELAEEILAVARQVRDAAEKLFEAGEVPQLDVFRAAVEVRQAESQVLAQRQSVAAAQRELALLIGRPADQELRAAAPSPVLPGPAGALTTLRGQALDRRPDLKAARSAVQEAQAEIDLVSAERWFPELRMGLKYEESREFADVSRRYLLTLAVPLPLFNRRDGDLERARAELAKQEAEVELTRRRIEKEVATVVRQVETLRQIVDEYVQRILPQQEKNLGLLREAYAIGEIPLTDVLVGQREFIESRETYLDAVESLNAATADLYRALDARLGG